MTATADDKNANVDLVFGVKGIARLIGASERKTYHLAAQGVIPGVFRLGEQWVGMPSVIRNGLIARAQAGVRTKETV